MTDRILTKLELAVLASSLEEGKKVVSTYPRDTVRNLLATIAALHERESATSGRFEGHDEPCYYCKETCDSLAGNPSRWPIALCHEDDPGVVKWHHVGCVSDRLHRIADAESDNAALKDTVSRLNDEREHYKGISLPAQADVERLTRELTEALGVAEAAKKTAEAAHATIEKGDALLEALATRSPKRAVLDLARKEFSNALDVYRNADAGPTWHHFGGVCKVCGIKHGREAEELRQAIEQWIGGGDQPTTTDLQELLDNVDARDALAFLEEKDSFAARLTSSQSAVAAEKEGA
ncbi:MAG: hypothetical protein ACHREM_00175 [Polyangiales bacterium]